MININADDLKRSRKLILKRLTIGYEDDPYERINLKGAGQLHKDSKTHLVALRELQDAGLVECFPPSGSAPSEGALTPKGYKRVRKELRKRLTEIRQVITETLQISKEPVSFYQEDELDDEEWRTVLEVMVEVGSLEKTEDDKYSLVRPKVDEHGEYTWVEPEYQSMGIKF